MTTLIHEFDPLAKTVDWLDACRSRDIESLIDLYDTTAIIECGCDGQNIYRGSLEIRDYWQRRLGAFVPSAFALEEIKPAGDGVMLEYVGSDGQLLSIFLQFSESGKIAHTRCGLVSETRMAFC